MSDIHVIQLLRKAGRPLDESVGLEGILGAIEGECADSVWCVTAIDGLGTGIAAIEALGDTRIPYRRLRLCASDVVQLYDGVFRAYLGDSEKAWLFIQFVDGDAVAIASARLTVIEAIRRRFESVCTVVDVPPAEFGEIDI